MSRCGKTMLLLAMMGLWLTPLAQASGKQQFYEAMQSSDLSAVEQALSGMPGSGNNDTKAMRGALLMKKAQLLRQSDQKLKTFREGKKLLESAIAADSTSAEKRFMRLMVQEHCPPALKYDQHLDHDAQAILAAFPTLPDQIRRTISDYSKHSRTLGKIK